MRNAITVFFIPQEANLNLKSLWLMAICALGIMPGRTVIFYRTLLN